MSDKTIETLYKQHEGLASDKWNFYLGKYQRLFAPKKRNSIKLLEIGVQNGGSLEIWDKYFVNAKHIVGCDVNPECGDLSYGSEKVSIVIGDIKNPKTLENILNISPTFDIVIDDGSHISSDIAESFCSLFPHINYGGIFVAEDLHCSYWKKYEGGLNFSKSSISFFKALADIVNFEHWGLEDHERGTLLKAFDTHWRPTSLQLAEIHSVEFVNSMCIVRKLPAKRNSLGSRIVAGKKEPVAKVKQVAGTLLHTPPQQTPHNS